MMIPKTYQHDALKIAAKRSALVVHPLGSGKTLVGVESLRSLYTNRKGAALIVCKKTARSQWIGTLAEQFDGAFFRVQICDAKNTTPELSPFIRAEVVVTHYEMLARNEWLRDQEWDMIVLDEAHRIKNTATQRTRATKKLNGKQKLALTGTPVHKHPGELFSLLQWLYPKEYRSKRRFFNKYVEMGVNDMGYPIPVGVKNASGLARELAPFTHVKTFDQLYPDYPQPIVIDVDVPMTAPQLDLYQRVYDSTDIFVDGTDLVVLNGLSRATKCQQISTYPKLVDVSMPSGKVEWLDEFIEDLDEKCLVFTRFRDFAIDMGVRYGQPYIVGGAPDNEAIANAFKSSNDKVLFGTIEGMGESLDFPNVDVCVFVDATYKTVDMTQAIGRINRPGSGRKAVKRYYYLSSSPTDKDVLEASRTNMTAADLIQKILSSHKILKQVSNVNK